ncbi:MAG: hypothetical protein E7439_03890 [Ruminococcaceae bacterium]|nr:hypothetical protein [Oscillospiraceae bacterium]
MEGKSFAANVNATSGKSQKRIFKRKRAGIVLTREEVAAIKIGRKKLRKELKAAGIKSKKEFELTAASLMLYFDKPKFLALIPWLFGGKGLWLLLGAAAALLTVLLAMSMVTELRGHFTINLSDGMFREGFTLSETARFENPTMRLFAEPAVDVPAFSIGDIKEDVNSIDGRHNEDQYFAYTYYIRNEGESTVDYSWQLRLNSETQELSEAVWVMVFEDDVMRFYAKPREDGSQEALPYFGEDNRGYVKQPLIQYAAQPEDQYDLVWQNGEHARYRLIPLNFESDEIVTSGIQTSVEPMEYHKYTVVIWLEGDDPDCTNEKIGGYAGIEMQFQLVGEEENSSNSFERKWKEFWEGLAS